MTETQEFNGPISFVRWLHAQAKGDQGKMMPYSAIYRWGKVIHTFLGADGHFDSEAISLEMASQGATAEDLAALVSAEAAWRVDSVIESAEIAGVSLDVGETEVVPQSVSAELASTEAIILCGYRNHRGEGCTNHAVAGAGRCGRHGGAITDPEVRRSFLLVAFAKVIDGASIAVDALLDVAENGRSEMARVQAAKELLDRAGVAQDQHVHIHQTDSDADTNELLLSIREMLAETKNRLRLTAIDASSTPAVVAYGELNSGPSTEDAIIDVEIVEREPVVVE